MMGDDLDAMRKQRDASEQVEYTMRDHLDAVIEALLVADRQAQRVREKADASNLAEAAALLGAIRMALGGATRMRERERTR